MTVEELIEKLKEFPGHMIVKPEPYVVYDGDSIIILFPKKDIDSYDYDLGDD